MRNIIDIPTMSSIQPAVRTAIATYVHRVITEYPDDVLSITLYGSQARGDADAESDIDLFIVVRHDTPILREALINLAWQVQFEHDVVISDIIRNKDQLDQMKIPRSPYYQSIEQEGILIWPLRHYLVKPNKEPGMPAQNQHSPNF